MTFNKYEDFSVDNPQPVQECVGTYNRHEPISLTNPLPVMAVDLPAYSRLDDVSEANPFPVAVVAGGSYSRGDDVSDDNPLPVKFIEGQSYSKYEDVSETNPWPVINTTAGGGGAYTGPLDLVPGAVVAYSVRALSAAMLGQNIFRLRRDSDDAEMDFAADAVTGDAPVAAITTWLSGANGFLRKFYDQSGNGYDCSFTYTFGVGTFQPAFSSNVGNGHCGFINPPDNTSPDTYGAVVLNGNGLSILSVMQSNINDILIFGAGDYSIDFAPCWNSCDSSTSDLYLDGNGATWVTSQQYTVPDVHLFQCVAEANGAVSILVDGVDAGASLVDGAQTPFGAATESVAWPILSSNVARPAKAQEFIVYNSQPNLINKQNIATYYGITLP